MKVKNKRFPPTAVNYSITKLEILGLHVNIHQFKQFLAKIDFDPAIDHFALTYIMKGNTEPASARIKKNS